MASIQEKEIAKEILIKALESKCVIRSEFPGTKTAIDLICEAYKVILKAIEED